jgi:hypothetical protein
MGEYCHISRVIVLTVLLVVSAAVGTSSARPPAAIPIPPIPIPPPGPLPKLPGQKSEKFKIVLEGKTHADRVVDIGGNAGDCAATLHEDIQENVTFGRGKGVVMSLVRYKRGGHFHYLMERNGRPGSNAFTVVANVTRTAVGTSELTPSPPGAPCPANTSDLSKNPDCGHPIVSRDNWGLGIKNDHIVPRPELASVEGPDHCGEPPPGGAFGTDIADITEQWPTPARLPFEKLPLHKIFNRRFHAFKIEFKSLDPGPPTRGPIGTFPLTGNYTDHGTAEATLRFIREH